jgi:hypothetical protein
MFLVHYISYYLLMDYLFVAHPCTFLGIFAAPMEFSQSVSPSVLTHNSKTAEHIFVTFDIKFYEKLSTYCNIR